MRPLCYRQRLFVESYLGESSESAADAARRAGYQRPEKLGPRLAEKSEVRAAINAGVATAAMAANEVLARVADVASSDLLGFSRVDEKGGCKVNLKLVKQLGLGHLIKRLRINKDGTQDIELEPRVPALVKLGEHYKLWKGEHYKLWKGEHYKLWKGEAQPQVTLVDLAKHLRARYEQLQRDGQCDKPAGEVPGQTGPVQ
jgi:hypothetical protein